MKHCRVRLHGFRTGKENSESKACRRHQNEVLKERLPDGEGEWNLTLQGGQGAL